MPSGTTEYEYDTFDRVVSVHANGEETRDTYDEHGNKASVIYPNGPSTSLRTGVTTEYGYDTLNRLISVRHRALTGEVLASYSYTFTSKGQREQVEERIAGQVVRTIAYTYDAADRLIEEQMTDTVTGALTITYTYDPVGNRLTKHDDGVMTTYTYDNNDRLLTEGGYSYSYDNNGNMLSKAGNSEQINLSYNALNQLVHADMTTTTGSTTVDYAYDHDGIRVEKTINGTDAFKYVVDKNRPYVQVLEEQRTQGVLSAVTNYAYGDDLLSRTTNGVTHYYQYDGLGSTRALSDTSGTLTDTYSYDAYGMLLNSTGTRENPYLYRGEQYDSDLSAYYLRARYYQPGMGRFLTTDFVEGFVNNPVSLHKYMYAKHDPVNYIDPSGEMSLSEQLTTAAIVGGLNAAAILSSYTQAGKIAYAYLGEHFFPDAMVLGVTGAWDIVSQVASFFDVPLPISTFYNVNFAGLLSGGIEILMNISSGQVAAFLIGGFSAELNNLDLVGQGYRPRPMVSTALYRAYVWNLWNANDYSGWFMNTGTDKWGAFWDLKRWFGGPWGISRTIWSKNVSIKNELKPRNFQVGYTAYHEPLSFELNFTNEYSVLPFIMLTIGLDHYINATRSASKLQLPTKQLLLLLGETSFWLQLTWAKMRWNEKSEYNLVRRQNEGRPSWFHSGPHLPYF